MYKDHGSISNTYSNNLSDITKSTEILVEYFKKQKELKNKLKSELKNDEKNINFKEIENYIEEFEYIVIRYALGTYLKRFSKTKNKKAYINAFKQSYNLVNKLINNLNGVDKEFINYKKYLKANKYFKIKNILRNRSIKDLVFKYMNKNIALILFYIEQNKPN